MTNLGFDLKLAWRSLARRPGMTTLMVVSVALTVGVASTLFSVLDAVAWRDLPVSDPARLAWVSVRDREKRSDGASWFEYQALARRTSVITDVLAQARHMAAVRLPERIDRPLIAGVSDNFFDMLGVSAARGTVFHRGGGRDGEVVISHRYWQRTLLGDPGIVGRILSVNGRPFRVSGVLPAGFAGANRNIAVDLFVPEQAGLGALRPASRLDPRNTEFEVLVRTRRGVRLADVEREADAALRQVDRDGLSAGSDRTSDAEWLRGGGVGAAPSVVFIAILVLVLLVAAANVANVRVARNEERRGDTAVRLALGATRRHLLAQHLGEMLLLGGLSAVGAALVAAWLVDLAPVLLFGNQPYVGFDIRLDLRTMAAGLGGTLLIVLIGAIIPFRDAARRGVACDVGRTVSRAPSRWLPALVVVQVALVTAIICVAGLFWRSLSNTASIRPAMDPDRSLVLVTGYWQSLGGDPDTRARSLATALTGLPGVTRVAYARRAPLSGSGGGAVVPVNLPGIGKVDLPFNQVSPEYFATTGARVLRGRPFGPDDGADASPVILVNEAFLRRFVPQGREATGTWIDAAGRPRQIVGVVEDGPTVDLKETPAPYLYFPFAQRPSDELTFFVAAAGSEQALLATLRTSLRRVDPAFAVVGSRTLSEHMGEARREEELATTVAGGLGALCLLLASAGLFGVTLFAVGRRSREFGVRIALGATGPGLAARVLADSVRLVAPGLAVGWLLAFGAHRLVQGQLYGVSPDDQTGIVAATIVVLLVTLAASIQPAIRAATVDPVVVLRQE